MKNLKALSLIVFLFSNILFSEQNTSEFKWEKYKNTADYADIYKCLYDYKLRDTPKIDYNFKDNLSLLILHEKTIFRCPYKNKEIDSVFCTYKANLSDSSFEYYIKNNNKLLGQTHESVEGYELNTPDTEAIAFNYMVKKIKESSENYKNVNLYAEKCGYFNVYTKDCEKLFLKLPFASEDIIKKMKFNHEIDKKRRNRYLVKSLEKQRRERQEEALKNYAENLFDENNSFAPKHKAPLSFTDKTKKWSKLELFWLNNIEAINESKEEYHKNCSKFSEIVTKFYGPIENKTSVPADEKSTVSKQTGQKIK